MAGRLVALLLLLVALALPTSGLAATGPITKGPWVQRVTATTALVRVEVEPAAPVTLELGLTQSGPADGGERRTVESKESKTLHSIALTGLKPGTRYGFGVKAGASSKFAAFTTAPADDGGSSFKFLVYGDNRTDDAAHAAIVRSMVPVATDFLVNTGDFVADGASAPQWQSFFDIEAPLLRERCLFSCVGNHELTDGSGIEYIRYFGATDPKDGPTQKSLPEHLDGTFRWGNTRFFFLNGMVSYRNSPDRAWLDRVRADADNEKDLVWRIVVVHHGPWSSGPHGNNKHLHEAGIPGMFRSHKIDLIISGHDHIYERGWAEGMAYLVSGGGGAPTYKIKEVLPSAKKYESVRHFIEMSVSPSAIAMVAQRADGSAIERCGLKKEGGWDCDGATSTPSATPSSSTTPSSTPTSTPDSGSSSKCGCRVVGERSDVSKGVLAGLAIVVLAVRRRRILTT